jgi:hypothetical protein
MVSAQRQISSVSGGRALTMAFWRLGLWSSTFGEELNRGWSPTASSRLIVACTGACHSGCQLNRGWSPNFHSQQLAVAYRIAFFLCSCFIQLVHISLSDLWCLLVCATSVFYLWNACAPSLHSFFFSYKKPCQSILFSIFRKLTHASSDDHANYCLQFPIMFMSMRWQFWCSIQLVSSTYFC